MARHRRRHRVVVATLGIEDRLASLNERTRLLDSMPELDSMAIVELIAALEDRFGLTIDEEEITGEVFESIGTLAAFVEQQRRRPEIAGPQPRADHRPEPAGAAGPSGLAGVPGADRRGIHGVRHLPEGAG